MKVYRRSMITGKAHTMDLPITEKQLEAYENGYGLIQDIFPDLTPDEREFIKSGITPEEFETLQ
jgi:hypothetical protein